MSTMRTLLLSVFLFLTSPLSAQDLSMADDHDWRINHPAELLGLIDSALKTGDEKKAMEWHQWSMETGYEEWEKLYVVKSYLNQARFDLEQGEKDGFYYYNYARNEFKTGDEQDQIPHHIRMLAMLKTAQGCARMGLEFAEANYLIRARKQIEASDKTKQISALVLMQSAVSYAKHAWFDLAEDYYLDAKKTDFSPADDIFYGPAQLALSEFEFLIEMGRYEEAGNVIKPLDETLDRMQYFDQLKYLKLKAMYCNLTEAYDQALSVLEDYETRLTKKLGFMNRFIVLKLRARVYLKQNRLEEATETLENLSEWVESKEDEYRLHRKLSIDLRILEGELALAQNDLELAREKITDAYLLQQYANAGGGFLLAGLDLVNAAEHTSFSQSNRSRLTELAFKTAVLNHMLGDIKTAKKHYKEVILDSEWIIKKRFANLTEKERTALLADFNLKFDHFMSFVASNHEKDASLTNAAFSLAVFKKGFHFFSQQRLKDQVLSSGDAVLTDTYTQWVNQKKRLSEWYGDDQKSLKKQGIDLGEEEQQLEQLEKKLSVMSAQFKNSRIKNISFAQVKNALKDDEAIIEMVRTRYLDKTLTDSVLYMALIVTPKMKKPEVVILPDGSLMESKYLKAYRNNIKYKLQDKESYERFWKPIAAQLSNVKKVYFAGDGVYHSLSLASLFNTASGAYLIDEIDIQRVISAREIIDREESTSGNKTAILYGYPEYNQSLNLSEPNGSGSLPDLQNDTTQRFFNGGNIQALPGTLTELATIQKLLDDASFDVTVLKENEATENHIKSIKSPQIVHIATHGFFIADAQSNLDSKEFIMGIEKSRFLDDPMLRSGLLMANAKQAIMEGGEGVLTAYEAEGLNLYNTNLVVLSACETGLGEIRNGEGVYGLQRAFRNAGANSLLMSLWTVSDQATQRLMALFYENWLSAGLDKRSALNAAREGLRKEYPHPYYWAAFVLIGN